jgi:hypothetical protein
MITLLVSIGSRATFISPRLEQGRLAYLALLRDIGIAYRGRDAGLTFQRWGKHVSGKSAERSSKCESLKYARAAATKKRYTMFLRYRGGSG